MGPQQTESLPTARRNSRRMSIFAEVGLLNEERIQHERSPVQTHGHLFKKLRPPQMLRFRSLNDVINVENEDTDDDSDWESIYDEDDTYRHLSPPSVMLAQHNISTKLYRLALFGVVLVFFLPLLQLNLMTLVGVRGGTIARATIQAEPEYAMLSKRDNSPTDVCKRFSGQSTIVNGTLYMYGFRTTTDSQQKNNTWTNDFLTLDLTKSWQVANPSLTGLPQPTGPPAVSLGELWSSHQSLWLYGGQYSDNPIVAPGPNSVWEYNIGSKQWNEHKNPTTSSGNNAADGGQSVQRAAEGAGFSVSTLGRGWYFGGHLDDHTTEGWSNQISRVYLKSLLEFTFPGQSNSAVDDLNNGKTAGPDGEYRNITQGGLQNTGAFPERADGALVYVPGFGDEGLLLGLTGGDNDTFTQMNVIDVYDIAKSTWYKQSTSGSIPDYRVNTCTTVAAAADGSSYNVYMFGGQNLQPASNQTQKNDMWILSVPSFTWIQVDQTGQSVPYARAGHACHVWDSQMIVIGGYIDPKISCESPGIYVFNMSGLSWGNQFTALTGAKSLQLYTGQGSVGNPLAQQANQRGFGNGAGIEGSYGYTVPPTVQKVIGGGPTGGATLTAPVLTATAGPLATGKAQTYTLTGPNGAIITEVVGPGTGSASASHGSGTNVAAIVAGIVAGIFFLIAAYFAFCAMVYRKQVKIWKNHAAMVAARGSNEKQATITSSSAGKNSSERHRMLPGSTGGAGASELDIARGHSRGNSAGNSTVHSGLVHEWVAGRRSSDGSIREDHLVGQEPSFWGAGGVLLNPRRSLRVINRD